MSWPDKSTGPVHDRPQHAGVIPRGASAGLTASVKSFLHTPTSPIVSGPDYTDSTLATHYTCCNGQCPLATSVKAMCDIHRRVTDIAAAYHSLTVVTGTQRPTLAV